MASQNNNSYCKKVPYKSKKIALEKIKEIHNYPIKGQSKEIRITYKCEECSMWHLSSMTKAQAKAINKKKEDRENLTNISKDLIEKRMEYLKKVPKIRHGL
jgi:peptide subunit release factor 1 (eRF1)